MHREDVQTLILGFVISGVAPFLVVLLATTKSDIDLFWALSVCFPRA